ncbi:protein takeout-like [Coccinella septempunctata]|uniref:protein takeout-like n=1 Tax=Coccinella septempunctata TaxID=41139 RepID=UPI001D094EF8|nr:protein takeout-like [Coccinella septempunctata]
MNRFSSFMYFLMVCCISIDSLHLPQYIKTCKVRNADFKKCAIKNGNDIIKTIIKGDRKYNIPPANPLRFPLATVVSDSVNLNSTNISIHGLMDIDITDVDVNLSNNTILFEAHIPMLTIEFRYRISGKISAFTIQGEGPGTVKIYDGFYRTGFGFNVTDRNGKRYMNLGNESFHFDAKNMTFKFGNLFNGDEKLEYQMTNYLNQNWRDVVSALGPSLEKIGIFLGKLIVGTILQKVPVDEIFPDF